MPTPDKVLSPWWTPTSRYHLPSWEGTGHAFPVPTNAEIPATDVPIIDLEINAREPQYAEPNWWTTNADNIGTFCCAFNATWTLLQTITLGQTEMMIVTGITYEVPGLGDRDRFEIQVSVNGQERARWIDMRMLGSANPAEQYAISGHVNPLPMEGLIVDRGQTITIRGRILDVPPSVIYSSNISLFLQGYRPNIEDGRDGAPRPSGLGSMYGMQNSIPQPDGIDYALIMRAFNQIMANMDVPQPAVLGVP